MQDKGHLLYELDWERTLSRRKPFKIQALEERSGSNEQRVSAGNAKERSQHRLWLSHEAEFSEEGASDLVEEMIFRSEKAPTRPEVIAKLKHWQNGEWSQKDLVRWARSVVDKVFFDEISPDHPDSIPIEIIMICSAMDRRVWCQADIAALMDFAQSPPEEAPTAWQRWFAHVNTHF